MRTSIFLTVSLVLLLPPGTSAQTARIDHRLLVNTEAIDAMEAEFLRIKVGDDFAGAMQYLVHVLEPARPGGVPDYQERAWLNIELGQFAAALESYNRYTTLFLEQNPTVDAVRASKHKIIRSLLDSKISGRPVDWDALHREHPEGERPSQHLRAIATTALRNYRFGMASMIKTELQRLRMTDSVR